MYRPFSTKLTCGASHMKGTEWMQYSRVGEGSIEVVLQTPSYGCVSLSALDYRGVSGNDENFLTCCLEHA